MLNRLFGDLDRDKLVRDLRDAPGRLAAQRNALTHRARRRLSRVRGDGQERLWHLQRSTLERAGDLLDRGSELPGLGRVVEPANRFVHTRLADAMTPSIPDYDDLNARDAIAALRDLDRVELVKVRLHESAHKNRKTVLEAVERELGKRDQAPKAA